MIDNKRILKTGALAVAMTVVFAIFAFRVADWTKGSLSPILSFMARLAAEAAEGPAVLVVVQRKSSLKSLREIMAMSSLEITAPLLK